MTVESPAPEMYAMYSGGATLKEVAAVFGVSSTHVRDIFRSAGLPLRTAAESNVRFTDDELIAFLRQAAAATSGALTVNSYTEYAKNIRTAEGRRWPTYPMYRRFGLWAQALQAADLEVPQPPKVDPRVSEMRDMHAKGATYKEIAARFGISGPRVSQILGRTGVPARPNRRKRYTDDELLAFLQEAAASISGPLTVRAYSEYAKGRQTDDGRHWPSYMTSIERFGTWRKALAKVGL